MVSLYLYVQCVRPAISSSIGINYLRESTVANATGDIGDLFEFGLKVNEVLDDSIILCSDVEMAFHEVVVVFWIS